MNMSQDLKTELLPKLRARYARRDRDGKSRLLDDLCEDYGYERKYAIKLLRDRVPAPAGRAHPGPEPRYTLIEPVVRTIWLAAEQPCGKRLAPALPLWLRHYERHHDQLSPRQRELLGQVSPATLDRLLAPARAQQPLRGRCGTKPGTLLRTEIPIRTAWDVRRPGYLEADSVAHCGASLAGDFIWSLTYTDIVSQWTEGRAVWNKGAAGVVAATRTMEAELPFVLLGFDCDNGSEFLGVGCSMLDVSVLVSFPLCEPPRAFASQRLSGLKTRVHSVAKNRPSPAGPHAMSISCHNRRSDSTSAPGGTAWPNAACPCKNASCSSSAAIAGCSSPRSRQNSRAVFCGDGLAPRCPAQLRTAA